MKPDRIIFFLIPILLTPGYFTVAAKTSQQYLEDGNSFLSRGKLNDALESYDSAISLDPSNYLYYFRRAATYLSIGRNKAALEDFTKILDLKPDFDQALLKRAKIYTKDGEFMRAKLDLDQYIKRQPSDTEATDLLNSIKEVEQYTITAESLAEKGNFDQCIEKLSSLINTAPNFGKARLLRAKCHIGKGEIGEAMEDLTRASNINPSEPSIMIDLALISYFSLYEPDGALSYVKQCLHYDPEEKNCKALFRKLKNLEKNIKKVEGNIAEKRFATVQKTLIGSITTDDQGLISEIDEEIGKLEKRLNAIGKLPERLSEKLYEMTCNVFVGQKDANNAINWCTKTLKFDDANVEALLYRAEAYILADQFEDAVRDLSKAHEATNGKDRRVNDALNRAQRLLKMSQRKDYYKILGISRSASKRDIKKAHRKAVMQWHPDKYIGNLPKADVEKKAAEINEAYEVLYSDELRERYDNGEDPYGSENMPFQQGGYPGGFPFGGFPFGQGGSQQFQFQFNF